MFCCDPSLITRSANPSLVVTSPVYDNHVNYPFVVITTTVNVTDDSGAVQSVYPIDPWAIEAANNSCKDDLPYGSMIGTDQDSL